jgi:hypothetical protein
MKENVREGKKKYRLFKSNEVIRLSKYLKKFIHAEGFKFFLDPQLYYEANRVISNLCEQGIYTELLYQAEGSMRRVYEATLYIVELKINCVIISTSQFFLLCVKNKAIYNLC